jgi:hypothetical protein
MDKKESQSDLGEKQIEMVDAEMALIQIRCKNETCVVSLRTTLEHFLNRN